MNPEPLIFIVDDDTDDREILRDAFQTNVGLATYALFENGDAVLACLSSVPDKLPSLIMLDLNMPGMDGRETLRQIKSNEAWQSIPIIVFTTSSSPIDKRTVYASGANCYITKPDTFDKLIGLTKCICQLWLTAE